jgi:hypothetical protein
MDKNILDYYNVGSIYNSLGSKVNFLEEGQIYAAPGVIRHIKKRHCNELSSYILDNLVDIIKTILKKPDLIGQHPDKPNSMEFVKKIDTNLLVSIEVDKTNEYIYVSTLFPIKQSKVERRLNSGRLKHV